MDRRQYLKHFMIILSGNGAAQAANLLSYPFLARLYTPEAFGHFALFVAVAAIPSAIACGRFDLAIPTAPRAGRFGIFWLCILVSAAMGVLAIGGSAVFWFIASTDSNPPLLSLLVGLCVFLTGVCSALMYFLMRHDRFRASSSSLVVRTGSAVACQLLLALVAKTALSLIVGFAFGLIAQALYLIAIYARSTGKPRFRMRDVKAMFARYRRQVTVDIPSTVVAAFSQSLMTFLLAGLYGQRVVGFYSIGNRLAIMPLQLFNDALGQTFFQNASRAREIKGHFWDEMKFGLLTSGLVSLAVLIGILLFARPFIVFYLGHQWSPAADMLVVLAPMLAIRSLTMSIATTVFVMRKAHWLFIHNLSNVAVTLLAYGIAVALGMTPVAFLLTAVLLLGLEYAAFALFLIWASRRAYSGSALKSAA